MTDPRINEPSGIVWKASRERRRAVFALERKERASGKWSPWEKKDNPPKQGAGWLKDVHTTWSNGWCVVLIRTTKSAIGMEVEHAAFRTGTESELSWKEKQRIKNELFGPNRMAIEIFPRTADVIDAAHMYHLWVFPTDYRFDFGLAEGQG